MLLVRWGFCLVLMLCPALALAQRATTEASLTRLEELLPLRIEGSLQELLPALVVSVKPAFEETKAIYPTAALAVLVRLFGSSGLRACEACMAPRNRVEGGRLELRTAEPDVDELRRLDEAYRGKAAPARTAIFLDETPTGVSLRMLDLRNSRILLAENFDPMQQEAARSRKNLAYAEELDRRARGDSLVHAFVDVTMYPGQHIAIDWTEQWGKTNANLSGVSFSILDPGGGIGVVYFRAIPELGHLLVGGKVLMAMPTALAQSVSQQDVQGPAQRLLTGVFLARLPLFRSNFSVTFSASTNGAVGLGFSLLNVSLLPFLP